MSTNEIKNILDLTLNEAIVLAKETGNYYKTFFKNEINDEEGVIIIVNSNEFTAEMAKLLKIYEFNLFGKENLQLQDRMSLS